MINRDWKQRQAYAFCDALTSAQWAWEFLRRNPDYQREWQAFWNTWKELEAAYGKPPNRDFCAWKNDPRAWLPASECADGECRIDADKVLIECALGARWGFHKFPPDPRDDDPVGEGRLNWRPRKEQSLPVVETGMEPPGVEQMGLVFDLSLPLKPQLEQARRQLQMEAGLRRRQGDLQPRRVKTLKAHWTMLLRALDARATGEEEQAVELFGAEALTEAVGLTKKGYLELLGIPP
ncbi:transcriptional regulator domain-containing protein [Thiolapillus sp.]